MIGLGDRIDDGVIDPLIALEHRAIHFLVGVRGLARALGQIGDVARRLDGSGGVVQRFGRRLGGEELGDGATPPPDAQAESPHTSNRAAKRLKMLRFVALMSLPGRQAPLRRNQVR